MRTVSPTLALPGVMDSLGPLGAAKGKQKNDIYKKMNATYFQSFSILTKHYFSLCLKSFLKE